MRLTVSFLGLFFGLIALLVVGSRYAPTSMPVQGNTGVVANSTRSNVAPDPWQNLGPMGISLGPAGVQGRTTPIRELAVAREWPADPFLYVLSIARDAHRTVDGGQTWESLPPPTPELTKVTISTSVARGRVMFGMSGCRVTRSLDSGQSWAIVLTSTCPSSQAVEPKTVVLSPDFRQDDTIFAAIDGRLLRSQSAGDVWEQIEPSPGRRVRQVVVAPSFSQNHIIFAMVAKDPDSMSLSAGQRALTQNAIDPNASDLLVSHDSGTTWASSSTGLEIDGYPFRYVYSLAISPTYGQDGTLFAFAWGSLASYPSRRVETSARTTRGALFRSQDRGATWSYIWELEGVERIESGIFSTASIALSPQFATTGVAMLSANRISFSPHNPPCRFFSTADYGVTWIEVDPTGPAPLDPAGCRAPTLVGPDGLTAYWARYYQSVPRVGWRRSNDGGRTMESLRLPANLDLNHNFGSATVIAHDGTFFVGASDGVWILAPDSPDPQP